MLKARIPLSIKSNNTSTIISSTKGFGGKKIVAQQETVVKADNSESENIQCNEAARKRARTSYIDECDDLNDEEEYASGSDSAYDSDASDGSKHKVKKSKTRASDEWEPYRPDTPQFAIKPLPKDYNPHAVLTRKFKAPISAETQNANSFGLGSNRTLGVRRRLALSHGALHDHTQENSIILYDPNLEEEEEKKELAEKEKPPPKRTLAEILGTKKEVAKKVHVVVDPLLAKVLRPHQIEGVRFLYKCTIGKTVEGAYGCIMADEMGLGKTLQCITLMWTLLRQSHEPNKPTIDKAIIACPSSLVRNWANELVKWLGSIRIHPLAIDNKGTKEKITQDLRNWASAKGRMIVNPVLIISYETLRTHVASLQNCPIGLLLCDEGHRLKNSNSLTFQALNSLQVQKRVILSGTPIQNDLSEYFSLLNFANPGLLGTTNEFRRNYETPILRGRDADATEKEREVSDEKLSELWGIVSKFIIRRTNDILTKYLPVKYEHVVFCHMSQFQTELYNLFTTSPEIKRLLRGTGSQPLKAIGMLKKLCNHPDLLNLPSDIDGSEILLPEGYNARERSRTVNPAYSGKMLVLDRMLAKIHNETNDKIVLISNYTQTLDLFERLCRQRKYGVLRLDGSMSIPKRQKLVDRFNDPNGSEFVFLLSSKAGGCGLNLIGANRLVLFDPDWNPAADQQALARVWRDGQRKDCFIYRFIATGTIEEKIFQRQSHKQSLSSAVVDEAMDTERHFSLSDLRQLFTYNESTICDTHEMFKCKRCLEGKQVQRAENMQYGDTSSWDHFSNDLKKLHDPILRDEAGKGIVSYVFQYTSHIK